MKNGKRWLCVLAVALGCAMPVQAFADEVSETNDARPTSRRSTSVQPASANSYWDTGVKTASQDEPAAESPGPGTQLGSLSCASAAPCCDNSCCCCDPAYTLIASVEGTFFFPQFNRDFLSTSFSNAGTVGEVVTDSALGSTDGSLLVGPRITLGVQRDCWGIVARYWNSSSWASNFTPLVADGVTGITSFDGFQVYTTDVELQRKIDFDCWTAYGFGGVRYASINNDRSLSVMDLTTGALIQGQALANQQFNGTGITAGFMATRPIGCEEGPLKAFIANRYSFLWGNGLAAVQTSAAAADTGIFASVNGAAATGDGDLFIGELQVGLQWEASLACLPGRAFVRTAIEYQYWDSNAGVAVGASSIAIDGAAATLSTATAGDLLFDLLGFNIGAGIMY